MFQRYFSAAGAPACDNRIAPPRGERHRIPRPSQEVRMKTKTKVKAGNALYQ
jgi:hypothetical protein